MPNTAAAAAELVGFPYRIVQEVLWGGWFDLVEGAELEGPVRRGLLERGSRFFFDYANRLSQFVLEEHRSERQRLVRGREERRMRVVSELLTGAEVSPEALDYDVGGWHVGAVVRGPQPQAVLDELAKLLNRRLLAVSMLDQTWAWLGARRPLDESRRQTLVDFQPRGGATIGFGSEARQADGFRRTHQQAGYALRAARNRAQRTARYEEIALEALTTRDETAALAFVADELAGLDGEDNRSRRLRETLRAYFAAGNNAARAAARLGVHEQTVAQRLRAVEERIGRPVSRRRAELETALRIRQYLEPS